MRSSIKTSLIASLAGLAALAATSGSALAYCDHCTYHTYYRPVVVRHCVHVVPHRVWRPEVFTSYVPVVRYVAVPHVRYVPETYYTRYDSVERVPLGGGYAREDGGYRDSSYGLEPEE